jgi:hypothetical protein
MNWSLEEEVLASVSMAGMISVDLGCARVMKIVEHKLTSESNRRGGG